MLDRYDTPASIVAAMIAAVNDSLSGPIADFAVGGGNLLRAAMRKWPTLDAIGTDIDRGAIGALRSQHPAWRLGQADLLNRRSRDACRVLRGQHGKVGLILINPPFSCRGAIRKKVGVFGEMVECGTATAFLTEASLYLRPGGQMVAIMPAGSLCSQRDREAWLMLSTKFRITPLDSFGLRVFDGACARTMIVHLERLFEGAPEEQTSPISRIRTRDSVHGQHVVCVTAVRGQLPMHRALISMNGVGVPLVHTTCIQAGRIANTLGVVVNHRWTVHGPGVLLPRVGEPRRDKIALLRNRTPIAISDCIK